MADGRFSKFFTLTKVDVKQRLVSGRATEEIPDHAREIMDYRSSKPNFEKWSEAAKARSAVLGPDGMSLGNVREMHQPVAAGKVIDIQFNDGDKAIDVTTYCADDSVWAKILKGVLTGFSIGGEYARRWPDSSNPTFVRYTANPTEISYVDAPAVPSAMFTMVKADGTEELVKAQAVQPDGIPGPNEKNTAPIVPAPSMDVNPPAPVVDKVAAGQQINELKSLAGGFVPPDLIDGDRAVVEGTTPRTDPVEKSVADEIETLKAAAAIQASTLEYVKAQLDLALIKQSADEKDKTEAKLRAVGARVGIARKSGEPLTPPKGYPTDPNDYADPANYSWPYDTKARTTSAIAYFNGGKGKDKYADREWNVLGRRIATRASKLFGKKYAYSPSAKEIEGEDSSKMQKQLNVMPLVSQVQQALDVAADQIGNDRQAMKDLLMNVIANLDSAASSPESSSSTPSPSDVPTGSQAGASSPTALKAVAPVDGGSPVGDSDKATPPPGTGATTPMTGTPAVSTTAADVKTAATPPTADSKKPNTTPGEVSTTGDGSPSTSSTSTTSTPDATKALEAKVDALTQAVAKLAEIVTGVGVSKGLPIVNLNGLQKREPDKTDKPQNPVLAALMSGDKLALRKAAEAAGTKESPDLIAVYDTAQEAVWKSLAESNVFSALYGRVMGPTYNPGNQIPPTTDGGAN